MPAQVAVTSAFQLAAEWRQTWGQDAPNSEKPYSENPTNHLFWDLCWD